MLTPNYWSEELDLLDAVMPNRVRQILLIASLYDSFVFEIDGFLAEQVADDFYLLNLSNQPEIIHATGTESTLNMLQDENVDIIVLHLASMRGTALELINIVKGLYPDIPIFLLLSTPMDLMFIENHVSELKEIEEFYYWNGDSKLFLAVIKQWEERLNLKHDTAIYPVPVILVIETFIPYYSQFLPVFYELIMNMNQAVIRTEHQDSNKSLYMNARARVLLLHDYQSALDAFETYQDSVVGVISNVNYHYMGNVDRDAGLKLLRYVRSKKPTLPFLLQSFNPMYRDIVTSNEGEFLYKDIPGLKQQIKRWLESEVGFGKFIFRLPDQTKIAEARTLIGFMNHLRLIPLDSLWYHFHNRHIENWLNTHAEVALSQYISQYHNLKDADELRLRLCEAFNSLICFRRREKIQEWNDESDLGLNLIYKIGDDSIGGKGRGLAFLNVVLNRYSNICEKYPNTQIQVPVAAVLATGEFDKFVSSNPAIYELLERDDIDDSEIDRAFATATLPSTTLNSLSQIIKQPNFPLAIRSSSVLEDSISNPFAGVFRTFLIPNSHASENYRLQQLILAVKLVYASMFLKNARIYRESLRIPSREEKMAVIIQKVAGSLHGEHFYPLVSGVAQSYNYYPGTNMVHEDGVVTLSSGLGKTAVERERTFAFCPKYPNKDMFRAVDIVQNAQRHIYAINPEKKDYNLMDGEDSSLEKLRVSQKLMEGELSILSSVWDYENKQFIEGTFAKGPRVMTFRSLLHYKQYPLADILKDFIDLGRTVLGCEVEMEFAFDVNPSDGSSVFSLLQIRPISVSQKLYSSSLESYVQKRHETLLFSSYALGSEIPDPLDYVVYLSPDKFSVVKTEDIAAELDIINQEMRSQGTKYVLIGPGRWGTSDRFLGIPVAWSQISNAKVIVEVVLPNMSIEASHGSHFFHNLFSMNVGYLTVWERAKNDYLDWEFLELQETVKKGNYFTVKKVPKSLKILFDGKNAVIIK